ncbi:MAG: leucyl aminopeptidase [Desulfamplus sp.]|nr:leucyl aminopeptidase [Desulfamplus sp.]
MKTTKVMASEQSIEKFDGDLLVFCVSEAKEDKLNCDPLITQETIRAYKVGDFAGKEGQTLLLYPPEYISKTVGKKIISEKTPIAAKRILVVGLGKVNIIPNGNKHDINYLDSANILREQFRKAGGAVASVCEKVKADKIMISLPDIANIFQSEKIDAPQSINKDDIIITSADVAECLAEGILLGDYRFLRYKQEKKDEPEYKGLSEVKFYSQLPSAAIRKSLKLAFASAQAVHDARDMANEPGNSFRASDFASYAQELAKRYPIKCTVLDKDKMQELGMGGMLAVNQGSSEPPKMVILEYQPKSASSRGKSKAKQLNGDSKEIKSDGVDTILLVGKGITFDSGGICLKQPTGMEDMKYDMCGGATVMSVMQAVGQELPDNVAVVAIVPSTDNLSGSAAMKPGDIIRHYNGVTSEIVNTDAEGRMILADALAYGIELFKPACVVDIATLTGAVVMGLGHHYSAVLGNNDQLIQRLDAAAKRAGEPLWRLPLGKEYTKQIESKVADIKNTGGKSAGTIAAAAYLEKFVGDTPWAHIDIAGTAWEFTEKNYIPKGASGIGVRTFLELIRNWKKLV